MRRSPPRGEHSREPLLHRLERAAGDINPFLIMIAIGLALLVFSVFTALEIPRLPLR